MIWSLVMNFFRSNTGRTLLVVLIVLLGAMIIVHYIEWTAGLEYQLKGEQQYNRNLSKREQIDETVKNKSDYDVCIANGGLHNDCK